MELVPPQWRIAFHPRRAASRQMGCWSTTLEPVSESPSRIIDARAEEVCAVLADYHKDHQAIFPNRTLPSLPLKKEARAQAQLYAFV